MGPRLGQLRVIGESVLILYLYFLLVTAFLMVPPLVLKALGIRLDLRPGTAITLGGVLIAEFLALWGVNAYYRRRGITLGTLGWRLPRNSATVVLLSLAAGLLYVGYTLQIPAVQEKITEISLFKLWGLLSGVAAAVMEEIVFRGYLMARWQQVKITPLFQVLLTGVAFSVLHLGFGLMGIVYTFVLGMALGGLYLLGRRSLLGPILCHGSINAIIEPWLLVWLLQFYAEKFAS
ncbi:MAG: CPBP family intramembrane metalloprotease [Planctomycetes bacterium]|jgi:hypothetical protein|nr:CPBP family intramembrane metalloprotease [Planctomycetota bacterium]